MIAPSFHRNLGLYDAIVNPFARIRMGETPLQVVCAVWLLTFSMTAIGRERDTLAEEFIAMAMQGDLSQAETLFSESERGDGSGHSADLYRGFRQRFLSREESGLEGSGNTFIDAIIDIYHNYWTFVLMGDMSGAEGEAWLMESIVRKLAGSNNFATTPAEILTRMGAEIGEQGYYHVTGRAGPMYDLVIWKSQQDVEYEVVLTDQRQAVNVVFMDEFSSMGWTHFATLGLASTSGWADEDTLYCVLWAYDRNSENFRISYLKHEGRHLADYRRFPGLDLMDLEYRAKLTELAFASSTTARLLKQFTANGAANPDAPHAFADYRVAEDLYRQIFSAPLPRQENPWHLVETAKVNRAARALLERHTQDLEATGR